jgi:hypothetical protein
MANLKKETQNDIYTIINDIRLSLRGELERRVVFILVEGSDDRAIFSNFFQGGNTSIKSTGGKNGLKKALGILSRETRQVMGIRDADFSHLEKLAPEYDNMFLTDCHDIEMTMLQFPDVMRHALTPYHLQNESNEILSSAIQESLYIAYIRWSSRKHNYIFDTEKINFMGCINITDGKVRLDNEKYLARINTAFGQNVNRDSIDTFIKENPAEDHFNLCNGHDVTRMVSQIVSVITGKNTDYNDFHGHLMSAFQLTHFVKTRLYQSILVWQTTNDFHILLQPGVSNA